MSILIKETYIDLDRHVTFGDSEVYEPAHAEKDQLGGLYRALRQEYGRCVSRIYLDTKSKGCIATGWVFQKRDRYEDTNGPYMREVWVRVYETCDVSDPDHLERKTRFGVEHVGFKNCIIGKGA